MVHLQVQLLCTIAVQRRRWLPDAALLWQNIEPAHEESSAFVAHQREYCRTEAILERRLGNMFTICVTSLRGRRHAVLVIVANGSKKYLPIMDATRT